MEFSVSLNLQDHELDTAMAMVEEELKIPVVNLRSLNSYRAQNGVLVRLNIKRTVYRLSISGPDCTCSTLQLLSNLNRLTTNSNGYKDQRKAHFVNHIKTWSERLSLPINYPIGAMAAELVRFGSRFSVEMGVSSLIAVLYMNGIKGAKVIDMPSMDKSELDAIYLFVRIAYPKIPFPESINYDPSTLKFEQITRVCYGLNAYHRDSAPAGHGKRPRR